MSAATNQGLVISAPEREEEELGTILSEIPAQAQLEVSSIPPYALLIEGIVLEHEFMVKTKTVLQHSFRGEYHVEMVECMDLVLLTPNAEIEHWHLDEPTGKSFQLGVPKIYRGILLSIQSIDVTRYEAVDEDAESEMQEDRGGWQLNMFLIAETGGIARRLGVCAVRTLRERCREFLASSKARLEKVVLS